MHGQGLKVDMLSSPSWSVKLSVALPRKVPPPRLVPCTLRYWLGPLTLRMLTPDPMFTSNMGNTADEEYGVLCFDVES